MQKSLFIRTIFKTSALVFGTTILSMDANAAYLVYDGVTYNLFTTDSSSFTTNQTLLQSQPWWSNADGLIPSADLGTALSANYAAGNNSFVGFNYALNFTGGAHSTVLFATANTPFPTAYTTVDTNETNKIWVYGVLAGPSAADTQDSLIRNVSALRGAYTTQVAAINNSLTYDCNAFDKNGICLSAGGQYASANGLRTNNANGVLIGAYKLNNQVRIGGYMDQGLHTTASTGIKLRHHVPIVSFFGVWKAKEADNGLAARFSAGYGSRDLYVTRTAMGTSGEAGEGVSHLDTFGGSLVANYDVALSNQWNASPYAGLRYTNVRSGRYTEDTTAAVNTPLTYDALVQASTTALIGVGVFGALTSYAGILASVGLEQDLEAQMANYTVTGVTGLTPIVFNPTIKKTRNTVSAGVYYDVSKTQRVSLHTTYRQEAFDDTRTVTSLLTYRASF